MYDAIVVGARCAGSPTAMLLARKGYKVLLLDRAGFPSDTLSTHYIHQPGVARLKKWGLLDKVVASNCPPVPHLKFDVGPFVLEGTPPPVDGVTDGYAPRRRVLDQILVDGAVAAGAELREHFAVQELLTEGDQVTGIRGHAVGGAMVAEQARIVVLAERARNATRAERFLGTADLPNLFRQSYGPGWALVGDAGYHKDPILAIGISDAFRDAELLAEAVDTGLSGRQPMDAALATRQTLRDEQAAPVFQMMCDLVRLEPPSAEMQHVFGALRHDQAQTDRFFGTFAGTVPISELFAPENLGRLLGAAPV